MNKISGIPRGDTPHPDRKFIESLARGLDVLRAFHQGDGFLGNLEISKRTNLPKSSVSRLTYTLTNLGYLSYSERLEKYQLGSGVLALGYSFLSNLAIRQISKPLMQELANKTETSIGLADRDRLDIIYVEHCSPTNVTAFRHNIGDRVPMASSSVGRAYLAALAEDEREYFMSYIMRKDEENWPQIKTGILDSLKSYQERGFCYSWGDWERDINGVSVPFKLSQDRIYVFSAGGPAYRITPEYLENEVAPQLKNMVRNIEATLVRF